ncbi:MAG TPA: GAF domain-containing protein [Hanamia sp.]|nr:GAF domain-containing protein [Hanamia sp.]
MNRHVISSYNQLLIKSILFSLFISLLTTANGQIGNEKGLPFITNYTIKMYNGNPANWSIEQDDNGIMYFGNNGKSARSTAMSFDGINWNLMPGTGNGAGGTTRCLVRDKHGIIYYGNNGDFGYLGHDSLGQTKAYSLLQNVPKEKRIFSDIWSAQITNKGIYFQSRERLFRLAKTGTGSKQQWICKTWEPTTHFMYTFYLDGVLYVHEQEVGLLKMVNDSLILIPGSEFLGKDRLQVMLPYNESTSLKNSPGLRKYLVGAMNGKLYIFDGKSFTPFKTEVDSILQSSLLYKGIIVNGNYAFATTGNGLVIIDAEGKLKQMVSRSTGLLSGTIYSIFLDHAGALWLGLDNGISKVEINSPFTKFGVQSGVASNPISIARLPDGSLYLGTNNGLLKYNPSSSKFELNNQVAKNQVFNLLVDGKSLLIGTDGLYLIKDNKTFLVQASIADNLKITFLTISKKYPNILYAGTSFGASLFIRDPNKNTGWQYLGEIPGIHESIWSFAETGDGQMWAGTQSGATYLITLSTDENGKPDLPKTKVEVFGKKEGFKTPFNGVFTLNHVIYFGSDSATYTFNEKQKRFEKASFYGLTDFTGIEDSTKKMWLGVGTADNFKAIIATPQPDGSYQFDSTSLLPINDIVYNSTNIYPDINNILWFPSTVGLFRYDQKIKGNFEQPYKTLIRSITAGKQILNQDEIDGNAPPEIKFNHNSLRFEYAAPFYEQENKIQYQTWLEGFEKTWSDWGKNSYKEYTNLSPGKYTFHVRAKNLYHEMSQEAVYTFTILAPWYSTWWAYLLYAIVSILIIYWFIKRRTRHLEEKHKELEKTIDERTAELSDRVGELAVINSVQEGLAKELDMSAIYNLVGDRIQKIFNAQAVIIASFDLSNKTEHFNYAYENGEKIKVGTRPINKLREVLIGKKHTIHIRTEQEAKDEYKIVAIAETKMPKSLLFVPLLTGNEIRGYVSIQNVDVENAFSNSDVRLLETLANSMSVALENARLFDETTRLLKETEQRTAELGVINSVQEGLVKEMNINAIYELVGKRLCDLFPDTQTLVIRTFDHEKEQENWQFAIEKGIRLYSEPKPINWVNKKLITSKKPLLINENFVEEAKKQGGINVTIGEPPKSLIFVPMIVGDEVKGSVSLQNVDKENAFSDSDLRLLTTLTNSMSVALENARLFDETTHLLADAKQRASELSTVNNISKALASQLNPTELIQFVGDQLRDLFKANIVYLALLDKKSRMINFPYQFGDEMKPLKLGDGFASKIILSGEPILLNKDVNTKTLELGINNRTGLPAASYLGVPIPVGDEIIGVLSVQSTEQENRFNENDQRLLTTIASSVGVALRNAQLFEDVGQAKMEAEKATKTAEKANEAKSAFLSTVSHELRTPLTSVLGFAKIINKRLNDKIFPILDQSDSKTGKTVNQINENLQVVISEGERLTHLINDVLDLAKIEAGKMEWNKEDVSLPEVVERAIAATTSLFEQKGIKLVKKIDNDVPVITGDTDKLIQVVINLFSNAVKFTDDGKVTCEVGQKDNEVIVSVTDTGIGIAPKDYEAVFEQFKQVGGDTLTDKPKGTGLGLPICKEIIEHHGGRIWVESTVGKGSTFSFALPFVSSAEKITWKEKPIHLNELVKQLKEQMVFSQLKIVGKNATILVVDDDDSIRSLLEQELGEAGYLIEQAPNGKAALESIRNHRPDLIILDVMMPEMNGFDVAAILKNDPQTMDIPIIILSIVQDKARGFRIGVDRYLTKPIDTAQLFTEVGNLLEQGKSKKKVMVVDEDSEAVRTLTDVLQTKGYTVVESDGKELVKNAIDSKPDIIILNSLLSGNQEVVKTLRFEKGLENVLFFIYQ